MAHRLATWIGLVAWILGVVVGKGVPIEDGYQQAIYDENRTYAGEGFKINNGYSNTGGLEGFHINYDETYSGENVKSSISNMAVDGRLAGNFIYSLLGFFLGGSLLFVSLFDPTRKPVIRFFDKLFGNRANRRRRDVGQGLEGQVAAAFDAFTNAVDKMEMVANIARK
ncbi:uncharacterized protein [Palaemon carinicauda]|uniref:uncharacterized protein n=1 Tax=Palaemon carinicauda TaxID=392227 RepID=UPI0035B66AF4